MILQRGARPEKLTAVNELQKQTAIAVLELGQQRAGLSPEEIAWVLIGTVAITLRNLGGPASLSNNLRSVAGKLHDYAARLDAMHAQPTDNILEH